MLPWRAIGARLSACLPARPFMLTCLPLLLRPYDTPRFENLYACPAHASAAYSTPAFILLLGAIPRTSMTTNAALHYPVTNLSRCCMHTAFCDLQMLRRGVRAWQESKREMLITSQGILGRSG